MNFIYLLTESYLTFYNVYNIFQLRNILYRFSPFAIEVKDFRGLKYNSHFPYRVVATLNLLSIKCRFNYSV